jgi:hypothetical protein
MIVEKGTENMWHLGTRTTLSYVTWYWTIC